MDDLYNLDLYNLLEKYRIDEEKMAEAFDAVPPSCKALIKTGIALADFLYGHSSLCEDRFCANHELGFWQKSSSCPVNHCFLLIEPDYPAMARVCAAAVVPKLAGVKNIYAIIPDRIPANAMLTTFELSGLEDIFIVPENEIAGLISAPPEDTRIFGLNGKTVFKEISSLAIRNFIFFYEYVMPQIAVINPDDFSEQDFIFALGTSPKDLPYNSAAHYDAVYLANEASFTNLPDNAQLALTPGCEGFWYFPLLNPDFFQRSRYLFGFCKGEAIDDLHAG